MCCLPIIIKQVFAIAGKTLAEDVKVEAGINDAIERIGQFGINCAFPGREIEAGVGRQAQSVILTDLGEEGGIPAITLYIGVVFETPALEGKARTERKRNFVAGHGGAWVDETGVGTSSSPTNPAVSI